jgi:hypothetical protein
MIILFLASLTVSTSYVCLTEKTNSCLTAATISRQILIDVDVINLPDASRTDFQRTLCSPFQAPAVFK